MSKLDRLYIELYSTDGVFLGYVKSVSQAKQKVLSANSKYAAKSYAKEATAKKDCELILGMTHGGLINKII